MQYKFDWDDGSDSGWLAVGHDPGFAQLGGDRHLRRAGHGPLRHAHHRRVAWSTTHAIIISDGGTSGKYNSPAQYKVLPEVIWAAATGGGTWMSACR